MRLTINIDLGNEEMRTHGDVYAAIERVFNTRLGSELETGDSGFLQDVNGNTIGSWAVEGDDS